MDSAEYTRRWEEIHHFLNKHYDKPDVGVLRVALCQYAAHFCLDDPPVWSFILGPSSSGKTRIILSAVACLPYTQVIGTLNQNTFLSGYGKSYGVLNQLEHKHGILLFPDFGTFLGLRPEIRADVQGQLRAIYDGDFTKPVGNKHKNQQPAWKGKVTMIAACTDALERYWSVERDLGERFLQVRMRSRDIADLKDITTSAVAMLGREKQIAQEYYELIKHFVDPETLFAADISDDWINYGLDELVELVAISRTGVIRDTYRDKIVDVSNWEFPGRLIKEIMGIAKGNAMLARRQVTSASDVKIAIGVGLNTIPRRRWQFLSRLSALGGRVTQDHFRSYLVDFTEELFNRTRDDLEAIKMLNVNHGADDTYTISLRPHIQDLISSINFKIKKRNS